MFQLIYTCWELRAIFRRLDSYRSKTPFFKPIHEFGSAWDTPPIRKSWQPSSLNQQTLVGTLLAPEISRDFNKFFMYHPQKEILNFRIDNPHAPRK
jgi:hypothetical protein